MRIAAIVGILAAGLILLGTLASWQLPAVLVYSGGVLLACSIPMALLPPKWLRCTKRTDSFLAGLLLGLMLLAAGLLWPVSSFTTSSPVTRLDAVMPEYNFHERHEVAVRAPAERVREKLNQISLADMGVAEMIDKIRGLGMGSARIPPGAEIAALRMPFVDLVNHQQSPLFPLADTDRELVVGLAGQPWNHAGVRLHASDFKSWETPGSMKIAFQFLIEDAENGRCRLVIETRIAVTDAATRRKVARYWALLSPANGPVRNRIFQLIRERAEIP